MHYWIGFSFKDTFSVAFIILLKQVILRVSIIKIPFVSAFMAGAHRRCRKNASIDIFQGFGTEKEREKNETFKRRALERFPEKQTERAGDEEGGRNGLKRETEWEQEKDRERGRKREFCSVPLIVWIMICLQNRAVGLTVCWIFPHS